MLWTGFRKPRDVVRDASWVKGSSGRGHRGPRLRSRHLVPGQVDSETAAPPLPNSIHI